MSATVLSRLAGLFGAEDGSDCVIAFYLSAPRGAKRKYGVMSSTQRNNDQDTTEPATPGNGSDSNTHLVKELPAHLVVIRSGSEYFRAQFDRWTQQEQQPAGSKPVLRVPLEREEDLPGALTALRFMYTGILDSISGAAALLRVRYLAAYLQVEGCAAACDSAVIGLASAEQQPGISPLAGVAELYAVRHMLPDTTEDFNAVHILLHACREQLVRHGTSGCITGAEPQGFPSLGDLLGWAFGDAPSVLNDPAAKRQMEALSSAAMEALLGSETFATDVEDTVVVLLACWLAVHADTPAAVLQRLCRLVRLNHLSDSYLTSVLPAITHWFTITPKEHRFLCEYLRAADVKRASMRQAAEGKYDTDAPWYSPVSARPQPSGSTVRSFAWHVNEAELGAALAEEGRVAGVPANFEEGRSWIFSHGFVWCVGISHVKRTRSAGVRLGCFLPRMLQVEDTASVVTAASPASALLVVYKWREDGRREEAGRCECGPDFFVPVGKARGGVDTLLLAAPVAEGSPAGGTRGATQPNPLDRWRAYLRDGRISGVLKWRFG